MGVAPGREVMTCPPCILKNHCEYSVIKLKKEVMNITSSSEMPDCGFHKCITVFFHFLFLFSEVFPFGQSALNCGLLLFHRLIFNLRIVYLP